MDLTCESDQEVSVDSDTSDPDYDPSDSEFSESDSDCEDVEDDDVSDDPQPGVWNVISDPFSDDRPQPLPEFTGVSGFNPYFQENPNFTECIDMFMPDSLLDAVVEWTNRRAHMYFVSNPGKRNKVHGLRWVPIDVKTLKLFIAYVVNMGLVRKPEIRLYWSKDSTTTTPWFIESGFSRDRFLSILKFLRFADHANLVDGDRLQKIRPFLTKVQTLFRENYQPQREVCVDESLVLYKGRLKFKQYIKSKRARFGVKIFNACSSDGYLYNFEIYSGQGDHSFPTPPGGNDLTVSERIVTHLLRDLLDLGYCVYTDNWYTSVRLAEYLLTRDTMLTGTVRVNRGIPTVIQQEKLKPGQTMFARKDNLLAVKYMDKREVHLISSQHTAGFQERTRFQPAGGNRQMLMQPSVIREYNNYMQGVDRTDQLMHAYDCTRKSYTWFKKIGIHFFLRILANAHYVFRWSTGSDMTLLTFLQHVINYLASGMTARITELNADPTSRPVRARKRRSRASIGLRAHAPKTFPALPTRRYPQRRCVHCAARNIRKDTRYFCAACSDEPALCLRCFPAYHH
jgi:Transposase IS4/DDE_Tnp_1-like zinc-ribbon